MLTRECPPPVVLADVSRPVAALVGDRQPVQFVVDAVDMHRLFKELAVFRLHFEGVYLLEEIRRHHAGGAEIGAHVDKSRILLAARGRLVQRCRELSLPPAHGFYLM